MLDWSNWSPEVVVGVVLASLLLLVIVIVTALCIQAGLFHTIHIRTMQPEFGELLVMYKSGRGAYSESGAMFTECHTLLPQYNTIGVYYDDPEKKSSENLRYIVGLVLSEGGAAPDSDHVLLLESHNYQKAVFPAVKHAVVTDFPYKSTLSCIFAVFRVYPALREYVERRELCAHPILELYDNRTQRILFAGPLEQQDSFYVPDVLEENIMSSPGEDSCDDDDEDDDDDGDDEYEGGQDAAAMPVVQEESGPECSSTGGGRAGDMEGNNWEQSASLLAEGSTVPDETGSVPQEESDTNTGSSFEEIDPSETAALPTDQDAAALPLLTEPPTDTQKPQEQQQPQQPPPHTEQQPDLPMPTAAPQQVTEAAPSAQETKKCDTTTTTGQAAGQEEPM